MNCPTIYNVDEFKDWPDKKEVSQNQWEMCRPLGLQGMFLFYRLRVAWKVFKGDWDAVKWVKQ